MFNETFWFFYIIEICDRISSGGGFAFALLSLLVFGSSFIFYFGEEIKAFKWGVVGGAIMFTLVAFTMLLVPPKEAFYGGATQYVGEATEIDQTLLLRLKELVDEKIEEQSDEQESQQ